MPVSTGNDAGVGRVREPGEIRGAAESSSAGPDEQQRPLPGESRYCSHQLQRLVSERLRERTNERANERVNAWCSRLQKSELKRELWRIEDVLAGLSASKANFKITVDSVQNPGEFLLQVPGGGGARSARARGRVRQVDRVSVQQRGNLCL